MSCDRFTKLRDSVYRSCSTSCHCYSSNRHNRGCCNSTGQNRHTYNNRCNTDCKPTTAFKQISPIQCSSRVIACNRVIITIRIHIVTQQSRPCADIPIRIEKPSPLGVIVPALQIVQPRVRIVVIPPIPERIERADNPLLNRCRARLGGNRAVAPCVIGVRAYLGSVFRVDGGDVPLQVLLEVIGVVLALSVGLSSVM